MDDNTKSLTEANEVEIEAPDAAELPAGDDQVSIPPISIEIATDSSGESVMATQAIINRQAARLDALKEDAHKINDSLKSILDNDGELSQSEMEAKEATKKLKARKAQLTQSAESVQLKFKLKETRDQIKELEESLNNHLLNYYQLTGTKVFDTDSGEQREFRVNAKIIGRKHDKQDE